MKVSISPHNLWVLVLGYMRYAMGRRSTAPSMAADFVRVYWDEFSAEQREQIRRELAEECRVTSRLGDACDVQTWTELLSWCEERL